MDGPCPRPPPCPAGEGQEPQRRGRKGKEGPEFGPLRVGVKDGVFTYTHPQSPPTPQSPSWIQRVMNTGWGRLGFSVRSPCSHFRRRSCPTRDGTRGLGGPPFYSPYSHPPKKTDAHTSRGTNTHRVTGGWDGWGHRPWDTDRRYGPETVRDPQPRSWTDVRTTTLVIHIGSCLPRDEGHPKVRHESRSRDGRVLGPSNT